MRRPTRCRLTLQSLELRNLLNAAPIASDDLFLTTQNSELAIHAALLNDVDTDGDTLSIESYSAASHGTVAFGVDGRLRYSPDEGFAGRDVFNYTVTDGKGGRDTAEVVIAINKPFDVEAARDQILEGVSSIGNPVQPGKMVAFGPQAAAIAHYATGVEDGPMVAAAGWGAGRVLAMPDHQWLNLAAQGPKDDTLRFYENSLAWLAESTSKDIKIVTLDSSGDASYLRSQGYSNVVNVTSSSALARELASANVFVAGWLGSNPSDAILRETADFVRGGGGLFVADYGSGYDWWWNRDLPDAPGNRLLREAGIGFAHEVIWDSGPVSVSNHSPLQLGSAEILSMLRDSESYSAQEIAEAGASLERLFSVLPTNDTLLAELDTEFSKRIASINPSPSTPVTDAFEKALLRREMDLLKDLPPDQVTAHRTAEAVYGSIAADAPRLTSTFTVDAMKSRWQATGMYAAPGEIISIAVPQNTIRRGYKVRISGHVDNISGRTDWHRVPFGVSREFDLNRQTIEIASAFGGSIYIDVGKEPPASSSFSDFDIQISGAVQQPHFVLGQTTDEDWQETVRQAPAPYAEFVSDHVAFSVPSSWIRDLDNPAALMQFWNDTMAFQDYVGAHEAFRTGPERINVDVQISVGLLHAGYPIQGPTWASEEIVQLQSLQDNGNWGYFHELGHESQRRPDKAFGWNNYYTFSGDTEVTVNIFANASLEHSVQNPPTGGWGYSAYPHLVMQRAIDTVTDSTNPSFDDKDAYPFYFQLADAFGWETYRQVFQTYHDDFENSPTALPEGEQAEKDEFYVRWSRVSGYDMTRYMVDLWGLDVSAAARSRVARLRLPDFLPAVAKTPHTLVVARDASVTLGLANHILSFDGEGSIDNVSDGQHGVVQDNGDGSWTYLPTVGYEGEDTIAFDVISSTGFVVRQTVGIQVVTQGVFLETFADIGGNSISDLTSSVNFPHAPDQVAVLADSFEAPSNRDKNFGARARGWLTVPQTGDYRFFIASDDNGRLLLSTDSTPSNARQIASVPGWTSSQQWTKYPEQRSSLIRLVEGQRYYIEALMKEGGGGDNLAVAWDGPGSGRELIPGDALEVFYEGNARPLALDDSAVSSGNSVLIDAIANDSDRDGDSLRITGVESATNGTTSLTSDGRIEYQPVTGFSGVDTFSYQLSDNRGGTSEASVTVQVTSIPERENLSGHINADGKIVVRGTGQQVLGLDFQSPAGQLVPGDSASPFSFFLMNTSTQVAMGSLGVPITIEGDLVTSVGFAGDSTNEVIATWGDVTGANFSFPIRNTIAERGVTGFVRADGRIVLEGSGQKLLGLEIRSSNGLLVPLANDDARPFAFLLSNESDRVTYGNLGTAYNLDGQLLTQLRYTGTDPTNDLQAFWGNEAGESVAFDIVAGSMVPTDCNGDGVTDDEDLDCACGVDAVDEVLATLGRPKGDLDGDGIVGFADFLQISDAFGTQVEGYRQGDVDCDGTVGFSDFLVVSDNFGAQG